MSFTWEGNINVTGCQKEIELAIQRTVGRVATQAVSETQNRLTKEHGVASNYLKTSYTWTMRTLGEFVVAVLYGQNVSRIAPPDVSKGDFAVAIGTPVDYGACLENGTRAHMPPIEPIIEWVREKGLSADTAIAGTYSVKTHKRTGGEKAEASQNEEMAWRIAMAIKSHGTKAHPHLYPGVQAALALLEPIFLQEIQKVAIR